MSKSIPKSLLSAYFDGEVSSEDRAAVSRIADKAPAVRQTLDDYAQLSETLKSLHRNVPGPQLRDAVLEAIQPAAQPQIAAIPTWWQRHWVKAAGGTMAVAAAGLLMMVLTGGRQNQPGEPLAVNDARPQPETVAQLTSVPGESAALALRTASAPAPAGESPIPEEWFTQQVANGQTPQPGDFMQYILREAEETVIIPVTVVDVQRTAGQIRVLLKRHGIQSLGVSDESPTSDMGDAAVAILVESDWKRFPAVIEDLQTEGVSVATLIDSSAVPQRTLVVQDSQSLNGESAALAEPSHRRTPPAASEEVAEGAKAAPASDQKPAGQPEIADVAGSSGMFLQAQVTDEFVEQLDQRQEETGDHDDGPAVAEAMPAGEPGSNAETTEPPATRARRFWQQPFSSQGPARFVFLIKKSGTSP